MKKSIFAIIALFFVAVTGSAQQTPESVLAQLTLEEKAILMQDISAPIPRLGIRGFNWWSEALHGVANQGSVTVFPEPIGMAASFNPDLVYEVFDATSDEFRATYNKWLADGHDDQRFHSISVWTPNINIFRDPRWGRGQETYGEDPYLTSVMGTQVIRGLQGPETSKYRKLYACAKHFAIHSGPEYTRHTANLTDISPRDLWETYLPAFKVAVQDAHVREVMCAYQRWDDEPCCGSSRLLQQILRDEWGFQHLVVSDCGALTDFYRLHKSSSDALHAVRPAALAGTDVECAGDVYHNIPEAVRLGLISEDEVDKHVLRLLRGRFELGEMGVDPDEVEWNHIPYSVVNCDKHQQIALDMARQSIVLLKNDNKTLPLRRSEKVAVIGPNADNASMMWGNYNGTPRQTVNIWQGIRAKGKGRMTYEKACDWVIDQALESFFGQCTCDGKPGMKATYWNNRNREGDAFAVTRVTEPLRLTTFGSYAFTPGLNLVDFSAQYEGSFVPHESGDVTFELEASSSFELLVNGESLIKAYSWRTQPHQRTISVEAGKRYDIVLRFAQVENFDANLKFDFGVQHEIDYAAVVDRLKGYETVVFVGGISPKLEGEEMPVSLPGFKGGDRTDIELPHVQRQMLRALHEAGKRVVFVNCSGSAMALEPEMETCDAIVQAWYAGEQGGTAVAEVLYGDVNPSGKLPVTFYRSSSQLPDYEDYSMRGRTYRYFDDALFPFGYGLSYTTFAVSDVRTDGSTVTATVRNTGKRQGTEVVQLYVRKDGDTDGPRRSLRAFQRVSLRPGESRQVTFGLDDRTFECFDTATNTIRAASGRYTLYVGTSSSLADLQSLSVDR